MAKDLQIPLLYDFYGEMLTDKQRDMIEQYYHGDLSLAEIAEGAGISRQGVRDSVKRAELQLLEMEERLGLAAKQATMQKTLCAIVSAAEAVKTINDACNGPDVINEQANLIAELASTMIE